MYNLTIIGLSLDVIGVFILALLDFPLAYNRLRSGKLSRGLEKLDGTGRLEEEQDEQAFNQVYRFLKDEYEFPPDHTVTKFQLEASRDVAQLGPIGDRGRLGYPSLEYREVRSKIQSEVDIRERWVRLIGFALLLVGFLFQMYAITS